MNTFTLKKLQEYLQAGFYLSAPNKENITILQSQWYLFTFNFVMIHIAEVIRKGT